MKKEQHLFLASVGNTCIERTADLGTVRVQVYFRPIKFCVEIRGPRSGRWETCYEFGTYPPARRAFYRTLRKMKRKRSRAMLPQPASDVCRK
jgi:hypothetical protein